MTTDPIPGAADSEARRPSAAHGALCFGGNLGIIALGLFGLGVSLHILLFVCLIWTGLNSRVLGYRFVAIRAMMSDGISRALPAIYIFLLIGLVIAAFMQSGTVAALIYYGLNLLSPAWFLAAGLVLCSVMSVATGTSWGTAGTLGVVLIGIGGTMGIPLPLVAGMIVCGATFGDKLSPVSDTTNLAAMSAGTSLFRHIGSMLYTTVPAFLVSLLIFVGLGLSYADNALPTAAIAEIQQALSSAYGLNLLVTLLPLLVMLTLSLRRFPAEVAMTASVVVAVLIAIVYQGQSAVTVLNNLWSNQAGTTGIASLDELLGRGGMLSMSWTLLLSLMALALGGMLFAAGFLQALLQGIIARLKRTASLIASTIGAGILGNIGMGEAYITIILNSQLFRPAFESKGIDNAVLSRSVEEGATMSTGLIPWTTAGAFYAATLGVPVLEYLPYAFLNYLNPLISMVMAILGLGLLRSMKKN
ncbi:MAG: Na+/H+ antiporter NhaC [Gammaproteobacteria bacterium]|nr:Na+/H+ antiporter NhaC [Gammaproteobacteria bacterium]|tara:strand:- start:2101 stop:3519 length:1419 start_codon:yes stop_codon:yes gene_type:complete